MSAKPPVGTPGIMSVAGLCTSMESNMGGVPIPASAAAISLQGTQLVYDEALLP
jgi:hypothetical protein